MKTLILSHYSDPGHGWVPVRRKLLRELGILGRVTRFSYERGATVYLEEDCDAGLLIQTLKERGIPYEWSDKTRMGGHALNRSHPIRSYQPFRLREGES